MHYFCFSGASDLTGAVLMGTSLRGRSQALSPGGKAVPPQREPLQGQKVCCPHTTLLASTASQHENRHPCYALTSTQDCPPSPSQQQTYVQRHLDTHVNVIAHLCTHSPEAQVDRCTSSQTCQPHRGHIPVSRKEATAGF